MRMGIAGGEGEDEWRDAGSDEVEVGKMLLDFFLAYKSRNRKKKVAVAIFRRFALIRRKSGASAVFKLRQPTA